MVIKLALLSTLLFLECAYQLVSLFFEFAHSPALHIDYPHHLSDLALFDLDDSLVVCDFSNYPVSFISYRLHLVAYQALFRPQALVFLTHFRDLLCLAL